MSIVSIGVDLVDLERFRATCNRNPALIRRVFTAREIACAGARSGHHFPPGQPCSAPGSDLGALIPLTHPAAQFLAGRFAVKEAIAKALNSPGGLRWHDCETLTDSAGAPQVHTTNTVTQAAARRAIATWLVSLSHDGGMVIAMVMGAK